MLGLPPPGTFKDLRTPPATPSRILCAKVFLHCSALLKPAWGAEPVPRGQRRRYPRPWRCRGLPLAYPGVKWSARWTLRHEGRREVPSRFQDQIGSGLVVWLTKFGCQSGESYSSHSISLNQQALPSFSLSMEHKVLTWHSRVDTVQHSQNGKSGIPSPRLCFSVRDLMYLYRVNQKRS